jgi:hypothetical protein
MSDAIPAMIGEHLVCLKRKRNGAKWHVVGAVTVTGLIASVPGTYKRCKKARSFKARRKEEYATRPQTFSSVRYRASV